MEWPISKTMEHFYFLRRWYKMRYGTGEDLEDEDYGSGRSSPSMPKMPSKLRSKLPAKAKTKMDSVRKQGSSVRSGRGASGHSYKFKKTDS